MIKAAPGAKALFWNAIKEMSFADTRKLLNGRGNEGTLSQLGITRKYQELDAKVRSLPFTGRLDFDLDQYVTDGALEGLFTMLAEEERKIRQNPSPGVTNLLKEVFGRPK